MKKIETTSINIATVFMSALITAIAASPSVPTDWPSLKRNFIGAALGAAIATWHWIMAESPNGSVGKDS